MAFSTEKKTKGFRTRSQATRLTFEGEIWRYGGPIEVTPGEVCMCYVPSLIFFFGGGGGAGQSGGHTEIEAAGLTFRRFGGRVDEIVVLF